MDYASCLPATERRKTAAKRDDFHYKSLFLVKKIKDNGTQKAVQRQRMGSLLCEQNYRDVWNRNESVRAEIGQILHTDTHTQPRLIPPSHRRRGATAVLVRHKPQWHRHDRRGSTVVPSLIVVAPRKTVKTADLRGGTAATINMFRLASAVLVPSHRRRGATVVLVRHRPHWHRHDRRGSAVVPSVIAVAPRKTVKIADLRGGTAETFNMFKTSAGHRGLGQSAVGSPRHRHDRRGTAVVPP